MMRPFHPDLVNFTTMTTGVPAIDDTRLNDDFNRTSTGHQFEYSIIFATKTQEAAIAHKLTQYVYPVLLLLGSVGNFTAFRALGRRHRQQDSVCFYMAVLVVTHTAALYLSCGLEWVSVVSERPHVATLADWTCKLWDFARKVFESASTWLLCMMGVDRFIRKWCPFHARCFCTVPTAKLVNALVFASLVAIHVHSLWTFEVIVGVHEERTCSLNSDQVDFETTVWPYVAASVSYYFPTLIIIVFVSLLTVAPLCLKRQGNRDEYEGKLSNVTLALSLLFVLWAVPVLLHNLMPYLVSKEWLFQQTTQIRYLSWRLSYHVLQLLKYTYYSVSYLLFFILLPCLQTELRIMLTELARRKDSRHREGPHLVPDIELPTTDEEESISVRRDHSTAISQI